MFYLATVAMCLLFLSVLVHEASHYAVARRCQMAPDSIIVGPLGGISRWLQGSSPLCDLTCRAAGPMSNLLLALGCLGVLELVTPSVAVLPLLNPLEPAWTDANASQFEQGVQLTLWINWLLFLTNLLPASPFDGGGIFRALLATVRPDWERERIVETVFWLAVGLAGLIMVAALILWKHEHDTVFPISFALVLLSAVVLVSARRDVDNEGAQGDEFCNVSDAVSEQSAGSEALPDWSEAGAWQDNESGDAIDGKRSWQDEPWLNEEQAGEEEALESSPFDSSRANKGMPSPDDVEAVEDRQVDAILSRLHRLGWASLSREERDLLERVSARYRTRLGRGG